MLSCIYRGNRTPRVAAPMLLPGAPAVPAPCPLPKALLLLQTSRLYSLYVIIPSSPGPTPFEPLPRAYPSPQGRIYEFKYKTILQDIWV